MAKKYDRLFNPDMTEEEYEKIIQDATDEATAAQATANAATSAAWGSTAVTGTQAHAHMTGRATAGKSYDYLSQQEKEQNLKAINQAVQQSGSDSSALPPDEDTKYLQAIHAENEKRNKLFSDYINEQYAYKKQQEDEMRRQEQANMYSSMGTGFAELGAGLVNMFSVGGLNAANQQYHSYSQDWMKKADQDIREHRKRRDDMKQTLDRLNLQMQEIKSAQSIQELQLRRQMQKEKEAKEKADKQQALQEQKYQDALEQQKKENAFRERQIALQEQQIQLQYDLHGWTKDPKTGRRVAPATGTGGTGRGSGSGSGSSSNIMLSIPPTTEGGKGTRLTINSGSLIATINANVDLFKSNDQKAIQRILRGTGSQDDKAKQLEQYIKTSPEILDLLKLSSLAVDEFDWGKSETNTDGTTQKTGGTPTKSSQDLINEL